MSASKSLPEQQLLLDTLKLCAAGRGSQALQLLNAAVAKPQQQPEVLLLLLELLLQHEPLDRKRVGELEQRLQSPAWDSDFRVLHQQGRCRQAQGDHRRATELYAKALEHGAPPELSGAQLAVALLALEQWQEAEEVLQTLSAAHPQRIDLHSNLAVALLRQNKLAEALSQIDSALTLCEQQGEATTADLHLNRGTVLQELGRREEAAAAYESALAQNPALANAHTNLGLLCLLKRQLDEAEHWYRQGLALRPDDVLAAVNLAGLLLLQGGEAATEGWNLYERRLQGPSELFTAPKALAPRWQGEKLQGPLLLVHEQGLGDTFQFIRYAAVLRRSGQPCLFQGPEKLHGLLLASGLVEECFNDGDPIPNSVAAWIPLLSLPRLLDTNSSPHGPQQGEAPYLRADPAAIEHWHTVLGPRTGLRIGLHWQGNPGHEFALSRGRSFPLSILEPLATIPNIEWVALQKGPGSEQILSGPFAERWHRKQALVSDTWDFQANAAILTTCDLVISSDSGLAHLAGGLGVPVWLLLPWLAEWRWGLSGQHTGWYAKHRLYRQPREGDWQAVVKAVAADLRNLASSHTG